MATVRILSWNIEVFGPKKYGSSTNNWRLINLVGLMGRQSNANIVVLMELTKSVAEQISFNVCESLAAHTGNDWTYYCQEARPYGDRESYALIYRANSNIAVAVDGNNHPFVGLSPIDFPCRWFNGAGRRPLLGIFRTTDTNTDFVVSVYHAPPNAQALNGLESLAKTPWLYTFGTANTDVSGRLLAGDYNLDVTVQGEYSWLTNPVTVPPGPPTTSANGAGTQPATKAYTHLMDLKSVIKNSSEDPNWGKVSTDYQDLRLDNIFYASLIHPDNAQAEVYDLVAQVMDTNSEIRAIVQEFDLFDANGQPVFANAGSLERPLNLSLDSAFNAWLITRYAISDHLPILLSVDL